MSFRLPPRLNIRFKRSHHSLDYCTVFLLAADTPRGTLCMSRVKNSFERFALPARVRMNDTRDQETDIVTPRG